MARRMKEDPSGEISLDQGRNRSSAAIPLPSVVLVIVVLFGLAAGGTSAEQGRSIQSPLDRVTIYRDAIARSQPVRVREFPTENADLGTGAKKNKPKYRKIAREMKEEAPLLLLEGIVEELKALSFADVAEFSPNEEIAEDCLLIEGEFTMLNPGSQGKRYMVGFGAGKSKICSAGRVVTPAGEVLAEFEHCRSKAMGLFFGGDSEAQMMKDSMKSGSRFAEFMGQWASSAYAP